MPAPTVRDPRNKDLGAYYTEKRVAEALCRWALRANHGRLLDPATGGGVFLEAAAMRGAEAAEWELYGVEVDPEAHEAATARLGAVAGSHPRAPRDAKLLLADFFDLSSECLPPMDAVVGNPPFIRFQRFAGAARARAAARTAEAGSELSPLAGSWVAFVAHASTFLARGGRLAMVLPAELGHSPYARPLLELLRRKFARTTFVSFRCSLFPHLDQETILLLADGYDSGPGRFSALELNGAASLDRPLPPAAAVPLDAQGLIAGNSSLAHGSLEPEALQLYRLLAADRGANVPALATGPIRLGDVARVESGYVTGGNAFFHLTPAAALEAGLPTEALVPALFRSRALSGLRFSGDDWRAATESAAAGYLVQAAGHEGVQAVAEFLEKLKLSGIDRRYKARSRRPWYRVARVAAPPLILAAMGAKRLPLVANDAGVAVPNTFHIVTPLSAAPLGRSGAPGLAAAWLTSLAALSLELEGHALGGGLLKLDPGEARNVLLPSPAQLGRSSVDRLDALIRGGEDERARCEADRILLEVGLGLSGAEVALLRKAAEQLRSRRRRS